ncbi:hypothetical protein [Saccharibacillus brassicae]|uniref:Uncharacterized protein n=1 Tax=Saccharibacillus brassicae TaxID=2583377 RepID=A0A4Y6UW74_SACBS|nr:hypothetical protein [Saccharibacillus brassicae]QDH20255.1 hypothetical protein FFV09_04905 [Saccharibacillus brassicae]
MDDKFFEFGRKSAVELIRTLFYAGTLPILYASYRFGEHFALAHPVLGTVFRQDDFYRVGEKSGWILGLMMGGAALIILVTLWKVICEMLLIALRYFERGTGGAIASDKRARRKKRRSRP